MKNNIAGITLVELLVAISIVSIVLLGINYVLDIIFVSTSAVSTEVNIQSFAKETLKELKEGLGVENRDVGIDKLVGIYSGTSDSIVFYTYALDIYTNTSGSEHDTFVQLKYPVKDADTFANLFIIKENHENKRINLVSSINFDLDINDTSILIWSDTSFLTDTDLYKIYYYPDISGLPENDELFIKYYYNPINNSFYRQTTTFNDRLPFRIGSSFANVRIKNVGTPFFTYYITDADNDIIEENAVSDIHSDSIVSVRVRFTYEDTKEKNSFAIDQMIYLDYKR